MIDSLSIRHVNLTRNFQILIGKFGNKCISQILLFHGITEKNLVNSLCQFSNVKSICKLLRAKRLKMIFLRYFDISSGIKIPIPLDMKVLHAIC